VNNFTSFLRINEWYNKQRAYNLIGYINDFNSRLVGFSIMRQIRVKNSNVILLNILKHK